MRVKPLTFPTGVRSRAAGIWELRVHRGCWTFRLFQTQIITLRGKYSSIGSMAVQPPQWPPSPSASSSHHESGPALPCQPALVPRVISTCPGPGSPLIFTEVLGTSKCTQQLHQSDQPQFMPGEWTGAKGNHEGPSCPGDWLNCVLTSRF